MVRSPKLPIVSGVSSTLAQVELGWLVGKLFLEVQTTNLFMVVCCFIWMMNQIITWKMVGNHQNIHQTDGCLGSEVGLKNTRKPSRFLRTVCHGKNSSFPSKYPQNLGFSRATGMSMEVSSQCIWWVSWFMAYLKDLESTCIGVN